MANHESKIKLVTVIQKAIAEEVNKNPKTFTEIDLQEVLADISTVLSYRNLTKEQLDTVREEAIEISEAMAKEALEICQEKEFKVVSMFIAASLTMNMFCKVAEEMKDSE